MAREQQGSLHWITEFYQSESNCWHFRAVFKGEEASSRSYPIGALLALRPWHVFNGTRYEPKKGKLQLIELDDLADGELIRLADIGFYKSHETIGPQWAWRIQSGHEDYVFPCTELARGLFLVNSAMVQAMMRPSGLNSLFPPPKLDMDNLHFDFSKYVTASAITRPFLHQLAWIYLDEEAMRAWSDIYRLNVVTPDRGTQRGTNFRFVPPSLKSTSISFVGMPLSAVKKNTILVLDIRSIVLPTLPISQISYTHPRMQDIRRVGAQTGQTRIKTVNASPQAHVQQTGYSAGINNTQQQAPVPGTDLQRSQHIRVTKVNQGAAVVTETPVIIKSLLSEANSAKKVSADESIFGGDLPPIQFSTAENPLSCDDSLYPFAEACRQLRQHDVRRTVAIAIEQIEGHQDFCHVNGRSRRCCVAEVITPGQQPIILMEMERKEDKGNNKNRGCSILEIRRGKPMETSSIVRAVLAAAPKSPQGWKELDDFADSKSLDFVRHIHPTNLDRCDIEAKIGRLKAMLARRLE